MNFLKKLLDPTGPVGEIASPSDVYKSRAGLPISTAHSARASAPAPTDIQKFLAPARIVRADEVDVPSSRSRVVNQYIEESFTPLYGTTESMDITEIMRVANTIIAWRIEQHARSQYCDCIKATWSQEGNQYVHQQCGRARAPMSDEEFVEHIQRIQLQASDEFYNGFYETIPGNDSVLTDAGLATGGTRVSKGRTEYNRATAGFIHWDAGYVKERQAHEVREKEKAKADIRTKVEMVSKMHLPRKLGEI